MQPRVSLPADTYVSEETPLLETSDAVKRPAVDLRSETYGTLRGSDEGCEAERSDYVEEKRTSVPGMWNKRVISLIVALSIFTYHSMTYDHLMPIFFEDKRPSASDIAHSSRIPPFYSPGGLGLSLRDVGMIMAVNGLIALFVQAVVFPIAAERVGVFRLFLVVTVLHPIVYVIVPMLLVVPQSLVFPAIYCCLAVRNILSIILYPLLLILIKEASPCSSALGKINGLAASAGAACRMIAPPIAGYLYTFGTKIDCTAVAWYGSAIVAVAGAIQCFSVPRMKKCTRSEEDSLSQTKPQSTTLVTEVSDDEE